MVLTEAVLTLGEASTPVLAQLQEGYDLLLVQGRQQQQQQQPLPSTSLPHFCWDSGSAGAMVQSTATLPALLHTPCLYGPLEVGEEEGCCGLRTTEAGVSMNPA